MYNIRYYLSDFISFGKSRLLVAFTYLSIASAMEGISLLLLIPLLTLTGSIGTKIEQLSPSQEIIVSFFPWLSWHELSTVLIVFSTVVTLEAVLSYKKNVFLSRLWMDFTDHLRYQLYEAMGRAEWEYHLQMRASDTFQLLDETVSKIGSGTHSILQMSALLFQAGTYLIVSLQASPKMTVLMLCTGTGLLLLTRPTHQRTFLKSTEALQAHRALYHTISEFFSGMKVAKSLGQEEAHILEFKQRTRVYNWANFTFQKTMATSQGGIRVVSAVVLSLFIYIAVTAFHLSSERLIVLIFIAHRSLHLLSVLQSHIQQVLQMLPSYQYYRTSLEATCAAEEEGFLSKEPPIKLRTSLILRNIVFSYRKDIKPPTLSHIHLDITSCQTIALTGHSGAGKSTLVEIIMGLLVPDEGDIWIDGRRLRKQDRRVWRRSIAYVPQEVFLFHESIGDNLRRSKKNAKETELWEALERAAAADFVARLPDKLGTIVGDGGIGLSGGERQRIALARAMLRKPDLLILDEATNALDIENERAIYQAIERLHGQVTLLIISHRLHMLQHIDQIVRMEKGRILPLTHL